MHCLQGTAELYTQLQSRTEVQLARFEEFALQVALRIPPGLILNQVGGSCDAAACAHYTHHVPRIKRVDVQMSTAQLCWVISALEMLAVDAAHAPGFRPEPSGWNPEP